MNNAAPDTFALLGPRPEVAPGWLEAHGVALALALVTAALLLWLGVHLLRRRRVTGANPAETFRAQLAAARAAAPSQRAARAADALRAYLAALTPDAGAGLTTQQMAAAVSRSPLLACAADPILRTLRAADQAKFAGSVNDGAEALALAELAFAHLELARQALWKEVVA